MGLRDTIGDKIKGIVSSSPIVEKTLEGIGEKTQQMIAASMDPESNPELAIGMEIASLVAGTLILWMICNRTGADAAVTGSVEDVMFRTITINNYYNTPAPF